MAVLEEQNSKSSNAIIEAFVGSDDFVKVAKKETEAIIARDQEDADKLQKGIDFAIDKKVIEKDITVEEITKIDVMGKTPQEVADIMLNKMGDDAKTGCVMTLQGFSGT